MYTYSQILTRNITVALIFSVILTVTIVVLFNQQINSQQQSHQALVKLLISNTQVSSIASVAEKLMLSGRFLTLSIIAPSGQTLFNKSATKPFFSSFMEQKPTNFLINKDGLTVNMQLQIYEQINVVLLTLFLIALSTLLIAVITSKISWTHHLAIMNNVSKKIQQEFNFALANNNKKDNGKTDNEFTSEPSTHYVNLPSLTDGLAALQKQINEQLSNAAILEQQAYIDPLTQLENRNQFIRCFEDRKHKIKYGVLIITRCSELQTVNQIHGYHAGDNYICRVVSILKDSCKDFTSSQLFRLNGSDFATILPNTNLFDAESYGQKVTEKFNNYQQLSDLDSVGCTGLVYFDHKKPLAELLGLADTAVNIAQAKRGNAWYAVHKESDIESSNEIHGNKCWLHEIELVVKNQQIKILTQQLKPNVLTNKLYSEVFARFLSDSNEVLPTTSFIAMAEKLDKMVDVDQVIIEKVLNAIENQHLSDHNFGINVSAKTIHDQQFINWLEEKLLRVPTIANHLIFEISEYGLQQNIKNSKRFIDMIHHAGSRITIERFGIGLTSFKLFKALKPDFIKMDSTYTRNIDKDKNNQYFLKLIIDLAHKLSTIVIAESIEKKEEKFTLEALAIDGYQGFLIAKPLPMT
jgi:diguanylate cyclase (GGDEF)-like protein